MASTSYDPFNDHRNTRHMNRSDMLRIFGPALAPVLRSNEIPEGLVEREAIWTLQNLGVPTSVRDAAVINPRGMVPVSRFLTGLELPAWAKPDSVLMLGLFLDGFLCLDGINGSVLLLTRDLQAEPMKLSDDLKSFVSTLVEISEATARRPRPSETEVRTLTFQSGRIPHGALDAWERVIRSLME
ncbi:SUKH-4 family immunity protein [Streptomyces sp. NPDC049879]|uniref:SUKH-4 family immunity protein n=1 Tax=Streptomyces sp. NPDC049879 TaxID=3365598 RepID=UPI0037A2D9C3